MPMTSRLSLPQEEQFSPAQQSIYHSILATRGNLDGPFLAWMHSPEMASHAEKLGAFCRYQSTLTTLETELLILLVAARFNCRGEQQIHEPIARVAGLKQSDIDRIRSGERADFIDPRLKMLQNVARELLTTNRISRTLYAQTIATIGERTAVEVVGIIGYYTLVAMTLNAFEMEAANSDVD